jgi:hypothetical protein
MHSSIVKSLVFGLLATAPLAAGYSTEAGVAEVERRHMGSLAGMASKMVRAVMPDLERRHHTESV